jgi:hypothetical protein
MKKICKGRKREQKDLFTHTIWVCMHQRRGWSNLYSLLKKKEESFEVRGKKNRGWEKKK